LNPEIGAEKMSSAEIYINFNIGATLYFGAVEKCSREIFYLKKFLLACGTIRHKTLADKNAYYLFEGAKL
jgi:hypothetical protein